jgi:phosphatidylinositol alpha-1,6-mannosyltransferase
VDPGKGWGRYAAELAVGLARNGVEVELHLPRHYHGAIPSHACIDARLSLPPAFVSFEWGVRRCLSLYMGARWVRASGAVVHSLVEVPYPPVARLAAKRSNVPYLVTMHGSYAAKWAQHPVDRLLLGKPLRSADCIVAISGRTAQRVKSSLPGVPVEVIGNGIDCRRFRVDPEAGRAARSRLGLRERDQLIVSVGALKHRKGFDTLLTAFQSVNREIDGTRLVIIGPGNTANYSALAKRLGVSHAVEFLQHISDEELLGCYNAAALFALLPRELPGGEMEGFGLVYLEAGACGKPVIGTKSGGVPDAIVDGETGFLVDPDNASQAADKMIGLLRDPELASRLGENGRRYAESRSWEKIAGDYLELYQKLVAQRHPI